MAVPSASLVVFGVAEGLEVRSWVGGSRSCQGEHVGQHGPGGSEVLHATSSCSAVRSSTGDAGHAGRREKPRVEAGRRERRHAEDA